MHLVRLFANIYKGKSIDEAMKYALINSSHVIQHSDAKTGLQDLNTLEENENSYE